MSFAKGIVLFSLVLAASSLVTPGSIYHAHRRHAALTPRNDNTVLEPLAIAAESPQQTMRKRSLGKRCKQRPAPTSPESATTTSSKGASGSLKTGSPPPPAGKVASPDSSTPTKTHGQNPTTTHSAPQSTAGSPSYMTGTQTGQGTWYSTGLGACGITNNDNQHICALSHLLYDTYPGYTGGNPNNNPLCGRQITVHYGGKSVDLTVTDRCAACLITDVDMSPSGFSSIADPGLGRIPIEWEWK
jgi:hypothetical protein